MANISELNSQTVSGFTSKQLETLLASMQDLVFVLDSNKTFIHCFQSASVNLLLPVDSFIGKKINEIGFPKEAFDILDNALMLASVTGKAQSVDYSLPFNNYIKWFNCHVSIIPSSKEDDGGFILIARDITDKKVAMVALQENEKKLSLLTNNINDLVALYRPDGTLEYISPSVKELLGFEPESLINIDPSPFIHPEDDEIIKREFIPSLYGEGQAYIAEYRLMNKDGQWVYFETNRKFIRNKHGDIINVVATCRDISAKKNAELALQQSEARYRSLVESSDAIIILTDEYGNFLYRNKIAIDFQLFYYGKESCNVSEVITGEQGTSLLSTIKNVIESKHGTEFETSLLKDENKIWLRVSMQPVADASGISYTVLINAIDITENKKQRELLEKQNKELQEINFMQSHTIRAPLTNIHALLNLVHVDELEDDNRAYFELIKKAAHQLDDVIKEIVSKAST